MCKAEELWKQVESSRRRKMAQDEIDSALMEYITSLERQRGQLFSALEQIAGSHGFRIIDNFQQEFIAYLPEQDPSLIASRELLAIKGLTNGQRK